MLTGILLDEFVVMAQLTALCRVVLDEQFGPIVGQVGESLLRESCPLGMLVLRLKGQITPLQVRKSVAILEQHSIVKFSLVNAQRVIYRADPAEILSLVRVPRCGLIVKRLYGDVGEMIYEELVKEGRMTCSENMRKVAERAGRVRIDVNMSEIKEKFARLVESQFLIRLPPVDCTVKGCPVFVKDYDPYLLPDLVLEEVKANASTAEAGTRKRKAEKADRDEGIYWRINFRRFDRHLRDDLVVELITGPKAGGGAVGASEALCRQTVLALLKANEVRATAPGATESFPISIFDMMRAAKEANIQLERKDAEWALGVLGDESNGVIRKAGDSSGGLYVVDFSRAMRLIAQSHIESLIREQLEGRAVRIFRLLLKSGFLEEEQIEKLVMMSPKETRELLYAMNEENYVSVRPVGKTNDFAPARTFYLYHVDFEKTVRMVEEYTCKFLRNLILRRKYETKEHRSLLDRKEKMETIIENIDNDENLDDEAKELQKSEVEQVYMSEADKKLHEHYLRSQHLLMASELEIERALSVFRMHLSFSDRAPAPRPTRGRRAAVS